MGNTVDSSGIQTGEDLRRELVRAEAVLNQSLTDASRALTDLDAAANRLTGILAMSKTGESIDHLCGEIRTAINRAQWNSTQLPHHVQKIVEAAKAKEAQ